MATNSYKDDEKQVEQSKAKTLGRLFKYLLDYKFKISIVLISMIYAIVISLINPLIMAEAIDNCVRKGNYNRLMLMQS